MVRAPGSAEEKEGGLKKGPWTPDEDQKLVAYIQQHGHGSWRSLPLNAGLQRCGKSCRLRWTNYLRPDIKRGRFSQDEDQMIVHLHAVLGNRWSAIASHLPRRTDNEIKNYWNTHLKKRLLQMGIDPVTHKSTTHAEKLVLDSLILGLKPVVSSDLTHTSQWDCARAEAEARLSTQSVSLSNSDLIQADCTTSPQQLAGGASTTSFMSSWKAQVAETLRLNFGVVELDKAATNPVNLQKFLQDWESSLQAAADPPAQNLKGFSDLSSETAAPSALPGSCTILPTCAQITERLPHAVSAAAPSFSFAGVCENTDTQFSPTSTLRGPEHDSSYTTSPNSSISSGTTTTTTTTSESRFDLLAAQSFPLIQPESELQVPKASSMFPQGPSFWSRQHAAMVEALQPESYLLPNVVSKAVVPGILDQASRVPRSIQIPHFGSLC